MRLAHRATPEQVDDGEQDDGAQQRDQQSRQAEVPRGDVARPEQRSQQEAREQGADDADDDVEENALLGIRPHHDAGDPSDEATDDQDENKVNHDDPPLVWLTSFSLPASIDSNCRAMKARPGRHRMAPPGGPLGRADPPTPTPAPPPPPPRAPAAAAPTAAAPRGPRPPRPGAARGALPDRLPVPPVRRGRADHGARPPGGRGPVPPRGAVELQRALPGAHRGHPAASAPGDLAVRPLPRPPLAGQHRAPR